MSDHALTEEPLHFGEGGRLLGILTRPAASPGNARKLPVFVLLSSGLLHRVGPPRLHVQLARKRARMGFSTLRVDLAGVGDSPPRPGLTNNQSVAADYGEIVSVLESRLGRLSLVVGGLCSAADNAIKLAPADQRVIGMFLLDMVCYSDDRFSARAFIARHLSSCAAARAFIAGYLNPARYIRALMRRIRAVSVPLRDWFKRVDQSPLRPDIPSREQIRAAFEAIRERDGRVLSVFTQHALHDYYNRRGQLARVAGVDGYWRFCTELFWPEAWHTFDLDAHRRRLIEEVKTWAAGYIHS